MDDNSIMPITPKYKGRPLKEVPDAVLQNLYDRKILDNYPKLKEYVIDRLPVLRFVRDKNIGNSSEKNQNGNP